MRPKKHKLHIIALVLLFCLCTACQVKTPDPVILIHGTVESKETEPYRTETEASSEETEEASEEVYENAETEPETSNQGMTESASTSGYTLKATVIDVGQGSSMLLESNGEYVLIDAGRDEEHKQNVIAILKKLEVTELSLVIASHYDYDHIGQLPGVISNFKIDNFWTAAYQADTGAYSMLTDYISRYGIETYSPSCGDTFSFGSCLITVNGPVGGYGHKDENQNSISVVISDGVSSVYNGADTTSEGEKMIMESGAGIDVDVYVCNHHGSSGSSSDAFLQALSPSWAIISCGKDNDYGHPTQRVLDSLAAVGAEVLRTDQSGDVTFTFDGAGNITFQ